MFSHEHDRDSDGGIVGMRAEAFDEAGHCRMVDTGLHATATNSSTDLLAARAALREHEAGVGRLRQDGAAAAALE